MTKLYEAGLKLRSANVDLANGRVWEAYETYTGVLQSEAPGHPYAFLNRALCLIILGHPALATFDCWRAISGGKWAKDVEGNYLRLCIRRYCSMWVMAKAEGDAWTTGCANGEIAGEEARWLAQPLADLAVRKANKPKHTDGDFPQARYVILCGYYRLAYALFKCGGGALQSALNMINLATEHHCVTGVQQDYFLDLQNHILDHIFDIFKEEDDYMVELRNKGLIELPRDRAMMEDNLLRGLMKSTFTTIPREQYPWDTHSVTTANFEELRPELEQFVLENFDSIRLAAIRSSDGHPVVRNKVPRLYLQVNLAEGEMAPLAFVDENGFFVWSRKDRKDFSCNSCEGCGSLLHISDDWLPPPNPRQQKSDLCPESDPPIDISTPGKTRSPPAEDEDALRVVKSPPVRPGRYYANMNAGGSGTPRPHESLASHPVSHPDELEEMIMDSPRSPPEEHKTPEPDRNAFEEGRPPPESLGFPEADDNPTLELEEDRRDSLYPHVAEALIPPSAPLPLPLEHSSPTLGHSPPLFSVHSSPPLEHSSPRSVHSSPPVELSSSPPSPRPPPLEFSSTPVELSPPLSTHSSSPRLEQSSSLPAQPQGRQYLDLTIPQLRERIRKLRQELEGDLRLCLGTDCCVLFCSKECEEKHAPAHDAVCDLGLEESLLNIETEQSVKVGGWWGGMVPTIPRQRVLALLMKKVIASLWVETGCADFEQTCSEEGEDASEAKQPGLPLQVPWVRLMDGNLDEPSSIPEQDSDEGGMHFVNDAPDGDLQFLFPGYRKGTARPSPADLTHFRSHKLPFSLDTSVIWPLQVLFEIGNTDAFFDIRRWDGWMLTTLAAKVEASARIEHFCRFSKTMNAKGMAGDTRCVDLPSAVRTNGMRRLQEVGPAESTLDRFTHPNLSNETELLVGSLHPLTSLIRMAEEVNGQPTVRLGDRAGDVFVFKWPVGSPLVSGAPLLKADNEIWPFKLLRDLLEADEFAGIGGRWANVRSNTVARWIRKEYHASKEGDPERQVAADNGEMVEHLLAGYRSKVMCRWRGGASAHPPRAPSRDEDDDGCGGPDGSERDTVPMELDTDCGAVCPTSQERHGGCNDCTIPIDHNQRHQALGSTAIGTGNHHQYHSHGFTAINRTNVETIPPSTDPHPEQQIDLTLGLSPDSVGDNERVESGQIIRTEADLRCINESLWRHLFGEDLDEKREQERGSEPEPEHENGNEKEQENGENGYKDGHQNGISDQEEGEEEEDEAPRSYQRDDASDSDSDADENRRLLPNPSEKDDSSEGEEEEDEEGEDGDGDGGEGKKKKKKKKCKSTDKASAGDDDADPPAPKPKARVEELDLNKLTMYDLGH
ncbi:hypothetical protein IWX49DRAFT_302426 [Phyllosticta citricarpa]|uniref:C2H2-type domain-containing protein n=2 Tax=Phyllosticta TaxID=121621 RepID=A0ABR1LGQ0_9PEZI